MGGITKIYRPGLHIFTKKSFSTAWYLSVEVSKSDWVYILFLPKQKILGRLEGKHDRIKEEKNVKLKV